LRAYQNRRLARLYTRLVERVRGVEQAMFPGGTVLTEAVARGLHRVLAIKDEYEVARLYTAPAFRASLKAQFAETPKLIFHMAPPIMAKLDPVTGHARKRAFGPWMMTAFRVLAPMRVLRGTWLDPFAHTEERQAERRLIVEYEQAVHSILRYLSPKTLQPSVELALLPDQIRGFGHVKAANLRKAKLRWAALSREIGAVSVQTVI
jgi:indolepyruvate ferredoxin oxidoreductase